MPKNKFLAFIAIITLSAGCLPDIQVPNIAVSLDNTDAVITQSQGFGILPGTIHTPAINRGEIIINTDLPSLQPEVTVVKIPGSGLNTTRFQNLTHSLGMPIGLLGDNAKNLTLSFSWTNDKNVAWAFDSTTKKISFLDAGNSPENTTVNFWPDDEKIIDAARDFLEKRGMDPADYRNIDIQSDWKNWKTDLEEETHCFTSGMLAEINNLDSGRKIAESSSPESYIGNCITTQLPSRIPVTFQRIVDERNILDKIGTPQPGGVIVLNADTLEAEYGWFLLPQEAQRSDYPAIPATEMAQRLQSGGLGGLASGTVEITETFFAFVPLRGQDLYGPEYLIPCLVGQGQRILNSVSEPYWIVVPLVAE
ncbi:MAG: hypothetical protein ACOYUZ_03595 [Patescibacteria group bacterium]